MLNAILVLSIPFIIILLMVIGTIHHTDTSNVKIGNMKKAIEIGTIGGLIVVITICFIFLYFLMTPPIPKIEIGHIDKNVAGGIICSKNKRNCLLNPFYSLLYRVGVYVEHPDKPGVLLQVEKHVTKLNWWNGEWKVQGINIKGSDTIHVFLINRDAIRNNKYHDNLKKEKGYFIFEDKQILYGRDKGAEIIDCDVKVLK
ncbi:hypothetical protein KKE26_09780 [bacterium]|nr:hypothetical protein [bacterium]MBU1754411.1 hypothetical protein [bacterium]